MEHEVNQDLLNRYKAIEKLRSKITEIKRGIPADEKRGAKAALKSKQAAIETLLTVPGFEHLTNKPREIEKQIDAESIEVLRAKNEIAAHEKTIADLIQHARQTPLHKLDLLAVKVLKLKLPKDPKALIALETRPLYLDGERFELVLWDGKRVSIVEKKEPAKQSKEAA